MTYAEACGDPGSRDVKGYNSSINGQIELNHRLALALERGEVGGQIVDSGAVAATRYVAHDRVRYVKDHGVREMLVPRLGGPGISRYLHLAITSDVANPFAAAPAPGMLPEIIVTADDLDVWTEHCHRFGWISWSGLRALAERWKAQDFLESYRVNRHYLQAETPVGDGAITPLPPDRPASGVSLVLIPRLDATTALHFSWTPNNCALRNYLRPSADTHPLHPRYRPTAEVLPLIGDKNEKRFGRRRPAYDQMTKWKALIERQNHDWNL